MAEIIDGKKIADELNKITAKNVEHAINAGVFPKIALINASSDPASAIYVEKKRKLAESLGILSDVYKFENGVSRETIANLIRKLNDDRSVHAILLQSPLFNGLDFNELIDLVDPQKDVDGLTSTNQGRLFRGEPGVVPCTPLGVLHLIHSVEKKLDGLRAVVIGRSVIVGKPTAMMLLQENCSVTILHSKSRNISDICKSADILVSAVGRARFVTADFVKSGAIVIDVGINRADNGKITGDVDFEEVSKVARAVTPVPKGVGPMTVAYLMHNTSNICLRLVGDLL